MSSLPRAAAIQVALIWAATLGFYAAAFVLEDVVKGVNLPAAAARDTMLLASFHAAGGAVAGYLLARLFGRRGAGGWLLSLLGAVLVTVIGGLLGGALAGVPALLLDSDRLAAAIRIAFGAVTVPLAVAEWAVTAVVWPVALVLSHLAAARARTARPA